MEWKENEGKGKIAGCPAALVTGTMNPVRAELMKYNHDR